MLIAQITDLHILPEGQLALGHVDTAACLARAVARLAALDARPALGEDGGRLCEQRLAWLAARLAEQPERPTLIMMHHPPFATGIAHMDGMALEAPERFAAIVAGHGKIARVICGHVHRSIQSAFAG